MKRIRGLIVTLILLTVVFSVMAQNDQNALRDVVEQSAYGDNWFISVGGNANLLTAEQDKLVPLLDRIKFGGSLTVGKWFNPTFGARVQAMGGALRGFNYFQAINPGYYLPYHSKTPMGADISDISKYKTATPKANSAHGVGIWQDFNYATATVDLMANFTTLMRGYYREGNLIDVIPFVGLGVISAFDNKLTTPNFYHFVAKIGIRTNFNISDKFAIYLEAQGNATTNEFDGYVGDAIGDGVLNLGLGVQYTFNRKYTTLSQVVKLTADEIDRLNRKINSNRYLIENHQDILERQQNLLDRLEKCCEENKKETVTQIIESGNLPEYVRFSLDSYKIEPIEQRKIVEVVGYLNKVPNSKLLVVGYADRKTGNPRYNLSLSQKRVEAVAAELKRLGINANRLITEWKGDKEQPFPENNEWNRVVIMVERK